MEPLDVVAAVGAAAYALVADGHASNGTANSSWRRGCTWLLAAELEAATTKLAGEGVTAACMSQSDGVVAR